MVNYNNDSTISTPPGDIIKVAILERRFYFLNALENYTKRVARGSSGRDEEMAGHLTGLFWELQGALKNDLGKKNEGGGATDYDKLAKLVEEADDFKKAVEAFTIINEWLYKKKLTQFDTRKDIDNDDIEAVNKSHGF